MTNKVVYEHILEAKEFTTDEHWRDIIDSCAHNKFPRGARYNHNKNILYVRSDVTGKMRADTVTLPTDPKGCYDTLMHVLKNLLGFKSDTDIEQSKKDIESDRVKNNVDLDCEWKKLKPRTIKNHIIMNFVLSDVEEHELNEKEVSKLYRLIQLGIQFKYLSSDDFEYENGVLHSIKGLKFDEKSKMYTLTNKKGAITHIAQNKGSCNHLEKAIDRWVKDYNTHTNIKMQ